MTHHEACRVSAVHHTTRNLTDVYKQETHQDSGDEIAKHDLMI